MKLINNFRYRPEIDGLRAIAVLAVVLFHAEFGCPGGYVGVDVFFVISGFLITSLIWKDLESGRFSIVNFWERRARRIVPALVVMTLAVLVAGWFLLMPRDLKSLGQASASQTVFMANVHYWRDTGYFGGDANEKPLLHTWSLAVEEQFYFVVPGLLWLAFFRLKMRSRKGILILLSIGWILSFVLSVHGVKTGPSFTFYMLHSRAWELLTGSLVAFLGFPAVLSQRQPWREILSFLGLALIFLAILFYSEQTPFPGWAALPPCLGAALFIWANKPSETARADALAPSFVGRCLAAKPVVFIGLISYSLYLWHWPFLAFSHYRILDPLSVGQRATMVVLGFVCAVLSWKFVETPFRERHIGASRQSIFALSGGALAAIFVLGAICIVRQGFPTRFPAQTQKYTQAAADIDSTYSLTLDDARAGNFPKIGATAPNLAPTVFVWGDSHARSATPAIDEALKQQGWVGLSAFRSSTPPLLGWNPKPQITTDQSVAYNDAVYAHIQSHRYRNVILIARWRYYTENNQYSPAFSNALIKTVQALTKIGLHPVVMLDVPAPRYNVPRALWLAALAHSSTEPLLTKPTDADTVDFFKPATLDALRAAGAEIFNPKPQFLDSSKRHYLLEKNGIPLYYDKNHLTVAGAKEMVTPFYRAKIFPTLTAQKE